MKNGVSDTKLSASPDAIIGDVRRVREQISASPFSRASAVLYRVEHKLHAARLGARFLHQRALHPDQAQSQSGDGAGHELLDLHRSVRRTRPPTAPFQGGSDS